MVLFDGWLDNADNLARALGLSTSDPATVYGAAVDRWGDDADRRAIGCYAAIHSLPEGPLRLARSPWRAPPLHYFQRDGVAVAASVPRALVACGLPARLNMQRLADSLWFNLTSHDSWYEGARRVDVGEIVHIDRDRVRTCAWYDHLAPTEPPHLADRATCVAMVESMLQEAADKAIAGSARPGFLLSGGLDSSNAAVRVLRALPPDRALPTFTFLPHPGWDGVVPEWEYASEAPGVAALAAMHPRLQPHFTHNTDDFFDARLDQQFLAFGGMSSNLANVAPLQRLYATARAEGCDLLLGAWMGNATISADGCWAGAEHLRAGRVGQALAAVRSLPFRQRPLWRDFWLFAVKPALPRRWQAAWDRGRGTEGPAQGVCDIVPLRPEAVARFDLARRAQEAGLLGGPPHWSSRDHWWRDGIGRGEMESGDFEKAMEQIDGVRTRDVTAYRPLVELCRQLPTTVFAADGQTRLLARELGKGAIPEVIRTEQRTGATGADGLMRLHAQLPALRAEVERMADDPAINELIDTQAVLRRIDSCPAVYDGSISQAHRYLLGLPRAIIAGRYIRFMTGSNAG